MRHRLAYALLIFLLVIGFGVGVIILKRSEKCTEDLRADSHISVNGHVLQVQTAKNDAERERGLGGRSCLPSGEAMLFKFDKLGYYPFWMKDMKFPIDIIWIAQDGQVTDVQADAQPDSYPQTFTNSAPADKVLELRAGQAGSLGIKSGSQLRI